MCSFSICIVQATGALLSFDSACLFPELNKLQHMPMKHTAQGSSKAAKWSLQPQEKVWLWLSLHPLDPQPAWRALDATSAFKKGSVARALPSDWHSEIPKAWINAHGLPVLQEWLAAPT